MTATAGPHPPPLFATAARSWAWLGGASFGGPATQIARLRDERVVRRRWLGGGLFANAAARLARRVGRLVAIALAGGGLLRALAG